MKLTKMLIITVVVAFVLIGCATGGGSPRGLTRLETPAWWNETTLPNAFVIGKGMGEARTENLARTQAMQIANNEIVQTFGMQVTTYMRNHMEQAGIDIDAQLTGHIQDTGETIARQMIQGVVTVRDEPNRRDDGMFVVFVQRAVMNPAVLAAMANAFEQNPHFQRSESAVRDMRRLADEAFGR